MHLLLGMSAFNSRFTKSYIAKLLEWSFAHYDSVDVIHPGETAQYLLRSTGTEQTRAKRKARKELARHIKAIDDYCVSVDRKLSAGKVLTFADFENLHEYKRLFHQVKSEFKGNQEFREVCLSQTKKAMDSRNAVTRHKESQLSPDIGVIYVLSELPIVLNPVSMLTSLGQKDIDFCAIGYYTSWPVLDFVHSPQSALRCATTTVFRQIEV